MMRPARHLRTWVLALVCGGSVLALQPRAPATTVDESDVEHRYTGRFRYVGGQQQRARLDRAIERATEDMNVLIRGIARSRLRKRLQIPSGHDFAFPGRAIAISYGNGETVSAPADGKPILWENEHGDQAKVSHRFVGSRIFQKMINPRGQRRTYFVSSEDGKRLDVHVRVSASVLPEDVRYVLSYRRTD